MSEYPLFLYMRVGGKEYTPSMHAQIPVDLACGKTALATAADWSLLWLAVKENTIRWDERVLVELGRVDIDALHVQERHLIEFLFACVKRRCLWRVLGPWILKTGNLPRDVHAVLVRPWFELDLPQLSDAGTFILTYTTAPIRMHGVAFRNVEYKDMDSVRVMVHAVSVGRLTISAFYRSDLLSNVSTEMSYILRGYSRGHAHFQGFDWASDGSFYCILYMLCFYEPEVLLLHQSETAWMLSLPLPLAKLRLHILQQHKTRRTFLTQLEEQKTYLDDALATKKKLLVYEAKTREVGFFFQEDAWPPTTELEKSINHRIVVLSTALNHLFADRTTRVLASYFTRTVMALYTAEVPVYIVVDLLVLANHTSLALYTDYVRAVNSVFQSCRRVKDRAAQ